MIIERLWEWREWDSDLLDWLRGLTNSNVQLLFQCGCQIWQDRSSHRIDHWLCWRYRVRRRRWSRSSAHFDCTLQKPQVVVLITYASSIEAATQAEITKIKYCKLIAPRAHTLWASRIVTKSGAPTDQVHKYGNQRVSTHSVANLNLCYYLIICIELSVI